MLECILMRRSSHSAQKKSNTWNLLGSESIAPQARRYPAMAAAGNRLYISGGVSQTNATLGDLWSFNLVDMTWTRLKDAPNARHTSSMFHWNGYLYLLTGSGRADILRYDISEDTWTTMGSLPTWYSEYGADIRDNLIYIHNGYSSTGRLTSAFYLDLVNFNRIDLPSGLAKVQSRRSALLGNYLYSACGYNGSIPNAEFGRLSLITNQWEVLEAAPIALYGHSMVSLGENIVLTGGLYASGGKNNKTYIYDPRKPEWREVNTGPALGAMGFCKFDDSLYIFGGVYGSNSHSNEVWRYDP